MKSKHANSPDIYIYKLVADTGGAPCLTDRLLSLAICKPNIRKTASVGSLIFGFGGRKYGERLIYIARITDKPAAGDYYRDPRYASRADCIYRDVNGRAVLKSNARYHAITDQRRKDVGLHFERAFVLLSDDFRYFGRRGTDDYKFRFSRIRDAVESLGRGHRRFHSDALREELLALKKEMWGRFSRAKNGPPTDRDPAKPCNSESASGICVRIGPGGRFH